MADQPGSNSSMSIGKWIVIGAILLFIGIFAFEGVKQGWLDKNTLTTISNYIKSSTFWTNWAIVAGALFILAYVTPPFKQSFQNENGKIPYFYIAIITGISLFATIKFGNDLIYKLPWISWLLPIDASGKFNWNPLINVGILWGFFCFLLPLLPIPHFQTQLSKFFNPEDKRLSAAPYVIFMILSLVLAFHLGQHGIWEKQQFLDVEHYFLGERAAGGGLFDTHTGMYQTTATSTAPTETRYGIFKTNVKGPDGDVFPLGVLGVVLAGLYILTALKFKELNELKGWKFIIFFFIAASAANRGVSLQGIITIAYFAIVIFTKGFIEDALAKWKEGALKKYLPWIGGIIVAEYAAEMVNPLTSPPYFPGGVVGKTIFLAIIIILWNFVSNTLSHATKAGLRFGVCQNCGKPCKKYGQEDLQEEKNGDEYVALNDAAKGIKDQELKQKLGTYLCETPDCPANSCQEISGLDALSASIGIRIGATFNAFITGMTRRNRDEERDARAAEEAAGAATDDGRGGGRPEDQADRRARLEARQDEIEQMLENHRNGTHPLTVTERNDLNTELRNIRAELATPVGAP